MLLVVLSYSSVTNVQPLDGPIILNWLIAILPMQITVANIISDVSRERQTQMMKMTGMTRSWGCRSWRSPYKPCSSRGQLP